MEKKEKEIDLLDVLSAITGFIGKSLKNCIKYGIRTVLFSFKKIGYLAPFLVLGIAVAFYLTTPNKLKYKAELILHINDADAFVISDIAKSLNNTYVSNPPRLAQALGITPEQAATVKKIDAFYLIDLNKNETPDYIDYTRNFKEDTSNVVIKNQICIRFTGSNPQIFNNLEEGFLNYLENNNYLNRQRAMRLNQDKEFIRFLDAEIISLDSLKNIEYFQKGDKVMSLTTENGLLMVNKEKQLFQRDLTELKEQKRWYERDLEAKQNVAYAISPLNVTKKPTNNFSKTLVICLATSYIVGTLFLLIAFNWKKLGHWIEEQ